MLAYICDRCQKKIEPEDKEALQGWKRLIVNDLVADSDAESMSNNKSVEKHLCPACYKRIYGF